MADLIKASDLKDYGLTEAQSSTPLVARLIRSASEQVLDAAGSPIGGLRSTVTLVQPAGSVLFRLPGLPIQEVHEVTVDGVPMTDYLVVSGGLYRADRWGVNAPAVVAVDYTHGVPDVPADIEDLVCRMVLAGVLNAVDGPEGMVLNNGNISSVAIDDFREAYATGRDVEAVTEMTLPERTRERLAVRFGAGGPSVGSSYE